MKNSLNKWTKKKKKIVAREYIKNVDSSRALFKKKSKNNINFEIRITVLVLAKIWKKMFKNTMKYIVSLMKVSRAVNAISNWYSRFSVP